ncbi:MAG: pyridoxal phosphate-dependent aminotransferase [Candidatus Methanomethylicota archaeon]|nr:pyridoxal phosphate-dependent aminotransferase [Candidatus Culexmicrobium cathedralense]RLE48843.1 MAG: pyridoxal phosphate-dependent aminotransferase [Candidatus Verstraetearchaeota archaeon]
MRGFSSRIKRLKPSPTLSIAEKARQLEARGEKIIRLDIGEPVFETPEHIRKAAIEALERGYTHYTPSRGIPELREAIADYYHERFKVDVDAKSEVIVTPGSKFAIFAAIQSLVDSGDEVIVLTPAWPTYWSCVELAGGRVVEVSCGDGFVLDEEKLKNAISDKSKVILVNSPNNPTGGVLSKRDLKVIADLALDHDLYIISDEIYRLIVYDEVEPHTMLSFSEVRDRLIVVDGFSKAWAMTGWRLGFTIAPKSVIDCINKVQQNATTCPTAFVQYAGVAALKGDQSCVLEMVKKYDERRRFLVEALNSIEGVRCTAPKGAFYAFPEMSALGMSSVELASELLAKAGVCTVPGSVFGAGGEHHLRICFASSIDQIREGANRIRRFVEEVMG